MAPRREWVRNRGGHFATDTWDFTVGQRVLINDVLAYHLDPGQTVVRTLLDAYFTIYQPGLTWPLNEPLSYIDGAFGICVSAQEQTDTHVPDMYDSFNEDPTIIGSSMFVPISQTVSPNTDGVYYNFALPETIDTHGQRHFPASGAPALIRVTFQVGTDSGLMGRGNSCQWNCTTYLRTLVEQSTS